MNASSGAQPLPRPNQCTQMSHRRNSKQNRKTKVKCVKNNLKITLRNRENGRKESKRHNDVRNKDKTATCSFRV